MKSSLHLCVLTALVITFAAPASGEETRRLRPGETSGLQTAPIESAPKFISKSAKSGPVSERSREYLPKGPTNSKSAVVRINYTDGSTKEQPYVEIPLLFIVGTAKLKDRNSEDNLRDVIAEVRKVVAADQSACFRIEGHASAEGDLAFNERLGADRAGAIRDTLRTQRGLEQVRLAAEGRGIRDARFPATAREDQLQQDRRVLVVREK